MANGFFSEEDKSSVMPYLCSQRKLDVVKILPGKTVCDNKAVGVPHGKSGKVFNLTLKVKANCG